jgi:hypothetical protein
MGVVLTMNRWLGVIYREWNLKLQSWLRKRLYIGKNNFPHFSSPIEKQ